MSIKVTHSANIQTEINTHIKCKLPKCTQTDNSILNFDVSRYFKKYVSSQIWPVFMAGCIAEKTRKSEVGINVRLLKPFIGRKSRA